MQKCNARKDSEFEMLQQNEGKEIREERIFREFSGQSNHGTLIFSIQRIFSCGRRMLAFVMENPPGTLRNLR
jgi:hypothetical protein